MRGVVAPLRSAGSARPPVQTQSESVVPSDSGLESVALPDSGLESVVLPDFALESVAASGFDLRPAVLPWHSASPHRASADPVACYEDRAGDYHLLLA